MKIFSAEQIRKADQYTIEREPILSIDLMERAAEAVLEELSFRFSAESQFLIFCGPGNNGGDGLAIARLLHQKGYAVQVFVARFGSAGSPDFQINLTRWNAIRTYTEIEEGFSLEEEIPKAIVVDALFGTGLSRPLSGAALDLVMYLNGLPNFKLSIDIPSGLLPDFNEGVSFDHVFHAHLTLTFQWPKLAFMFAHLGSAVGEFVVLDIGLWPQYEIETATTNHFLTANEVQKMLRARPKFSHKNSFGHVAIYAGSKGKMGAAVLSSRAALRAGAGLVTAVVPSIGYQIMQTSVPEAMCISGALENHLCSGDYQSGYEFVALGPGIGTNPETEQMLKLAIQSGAKPLVLDADALNILSENPTWMAFLPPMSMLTPHPGEFDRLAGKQLSPESRYHEAIRMAIRFGVIVILKGAYTQIALPNGSSYFNSTGNPGIATAGSGDVLTGIIVGLLAQGYTPVESAILGVYLHGLAGDAALENQSVESLVSGDIIENIGKAFSNLADL